MVIYMGYGGLFKFKVTKIQIILTILIVAGFILRIKDLGARSLWLDEAISSIAAVAFLKDGIPVLPSGVLYDRALLNTFLIAPSFKFFGINESAARLPGVLFGTLTILLVYFIVSKLAFYMETDKGDTVRVYGWGDETKT